MFYESVFRELYKEKIDYLVVGGVAINLYGILRATADLDLFLWLQDTENVTKFLGVMKRLGYRPRAPVPAEELGDPSKRKAWQEEKGALVFTFVHPNSFEQVDIFLNEPIPFQEAFRQRRVMPVSDFEISVVSMKDLQTLKEKAGREKDLSDLTHLKRREELGGHGQ
jgi:hypothetical protein